MIISNIPARQRHSGDDDSFIDWALLHKRELTWAIVALAALVLGLWYYQRSHTLQAQKAERLYFTARQSVAAGNLPAAVTGFERVTGSYAGTRAGAQAAISLAQILYEQKKYREGISALKKAESNAPADFIPSLHLLEADGYDELKDYGSAAEQYKLAAQATRFPAEKNDYRTKAARAYMEAGKAVEARAIWEDLAKDETSPAAAEARVRLGEVTAQPIKT